MARYTALIDGEAGSYGVSFPDLPGCAAMGATIEAAITNAGEALRDWVDATVRAGGDVPAPRTAEALRQDAEVAEALAEGAILTIIPLVRVTGKPVKANMSLDEGILAAIDEAAKRRGMTRSAYVELMAKVTLSKL